MERLERSREQPDAARGAAAQADAPAGLEGLRVSVTHDPADVEQAWRCLEAHATSPFADYAWARAWFDAHAETGRARPVIVTGFDAHGAALFLLPFSLERRGPFSVLTWPGGTHSTYQAALFSPRCRMLVNERTAGMFWAQILDALPAADAIAGFGLPRTEIDANSPLAHLPLHYCDCNSYRMALSADWNAVYERKANTKARRNDRRGERRLREMGDLKFRVARTPEERTEILRILMQQKSDRLRRGGLPDFLRAPQTRAFYERLAASGEWGGDRSAHLTALELGGEVIAASLALTHGADCHGLILSMTSNESERCGPGRLLLRHTLEDLCRSGYAVFDFGMGDADFKGGWHDEVIERCDVLVPLNRRGRLYIALLKGFIAAKVAIKCSPRLSWLATQVLCVAQI